MALLDRQAKFRVLVVTNLWPGGSAPGYGSFVRAQMESLRPLGVDYDVLFIDGRRSKWNYVRAIAELRRRLKARRYDLIHAHFGLSGWVARFQWRVPVVVSFMGDDVLGRILPSGRVSLYGWILQVTSYLLARRVEGVIVKSHEMKSRLGLDSAQVIANGVDLALFQPMDTDDARRELGLDLKRKYVIFPYHLAEARKRFDLIEEAVKLARREIPNLEILHVRGVPSDRMPLYFNAANVFVLASMAEGSPNAVKEAMAVNLPVITVDVGDAVDLVGPTAGCYVVPRDAEAIAAKLIEVCRRGTRTHGREWMAPLGIERVAAEIVRVYESVTKHERPSREGGLT